MWLKNFKILFLKIFAIFPRQHCFPNSSFNYFICCICENYHTQKKGQFGVGTNVAGYWVLTQLPTQLSSKLSYQVT
jgi:hypothetical protein